MALKNDNPAIEKETELTPIVEGDDSVVADFFLPGCCTFDDDCNPMCMTEEEMLELAIPPFAKSDYITTTKNTPVNIYAFLNDDPIYGDKVTINPGMFEMLTTKGGRIVLASDKSYFMYTPGPGYTGKDRFRYSVYNTVNKLRDTATVYINVIEGDANVLVQPTISVMASFCGGPSYTTYIPINITAGSYPNSIFTIENENLYNWLVKTPKSAGPGFDYAIDPSKFTESQSFVLKLMRDGIPTTQTAPFSVNVVIAEFDFELSMLAFEDPMFDFGKTTTESLFFKSRTMTIEEESLNTKDMLAFDEKTTSRITLPGGDPIRSQQFTVRIDITNNSVDASSFYWELLYSLKGSPILDQTTNESVKTFFWTVPAETLASGAYIRLTAQSKGGCSAVRIKRIEPVVIK